MYAVGRSAAKAALLQYNISSKNIKRNHCSKQTVYEFPAQHEHERALSPDLTKVAEWGYFFKPGFVVHDIATQSRQELSQTAEFYFSDRPQECSVMKAAWQADSRHASLLITYAYVSRPACFASYNVQAQAYVCLRNVLHLQGLGKMSPDGRSLLYLAQEGTFALAPGVMSLRIISFDTPATLQLPNSAWLAPQNNLLQAALAWSPSSSRVAVLAHRLCVHDTSSGAILLDIDADQHMLLRASQKRLPGDERPWCWRGDESLLVLHAASQQSRGFCISEVMLSEDDAHACMVVVQDILPGQAEDAVHCSKLRVSPSGQQLAMTIKLGDVKYVPFDHSDMTIVADLPSGTFQARQHVAYYSSPFLWSPCSRYLAFVHQLDKHNRDRLGHIVIFDVSGDDAFSHEMTFVKLNAWPLHAIWSGDCSHLMLLLECSHLESMGHNFLQVVMQAWHVTKVSFLHMSSLPSFT